MSTINDVARRAGVSTMTVSRVINKSGYISHETLERVEKAIAELDYVPNALARSLRFKQTKTIALMLSDITNPFFTTIARGVEDVASANGFSVIYCNTDESREEEAEYLYTLLQKQVDGLLLVPVGNSGDSITYLQERGEPVVVLDRRVSGVNVDTVRCDSEKGAYELTRHLLSLGHQHIAALSGPSSASTSTDRVEGYRRALKEAGLEVAPHLVRFGQFAQSSGYQMTQEVLAISPRPTAIFAANNFISIGAYHALRDAGLQVPEDVSMATFDDLPTTMMLEPFFTVAAQPAYEMGHKATELLLSRLAGEGPVEPQEIILPIQMILRTSSRKLEAE